MALVFILLLLGCFPCEACAEDPACPEGNEKAALGGTVEGSWSRLLSSDLKDSDCREAVVNRFLCGDTDCRGLVSLPWDFGDSGCCDFNEDRLSLGGNIDKPLISVLVGFAGGFPSFPEPPARPFDFFLFPLRCSKL